MPSLADRIEFGPPRDPASPRAYALALLAHVLLIAALTWGVHWQSTDKAVAFEAELWSSLPQEAAPKLVEAPTPPPPPPPVTPEVKAAPTPNVDIALEQEKKRKLVQQQKDAELQKQQDRLKAEALAKKEKEQKAKEELVKRKAAEDAKKAEARKEDAKDLEKQKRADAAEKKQRQEALNRMMGLAGAPGADNAKGSAQQAAGPSATYSARLAALFKRKINFPPTSSISGNPKAIVQVKVSPTGLILSSRLVKSSGVPSWDEAVLRAVESTERIPLDENGKVVSDFPVEFGPKD